MRGLFSYKCIVCGKTVPCIHYYSIRRKYCSDKCHMQGKGNPMYGRHHKKSTKKLIAENNMRWLKDKGHPMLGRKRPDTILRNLVNNPMFHRACREKMRQKKLALHLSPPTKGKTWEEYFGEEKATCMKALSSKNNPSKQPKVRRKISNGNKLFLLNHPERHPNFLQRRNRKTDCEKRMQLLIESLGFREGSDFVFNSYVKTRVGYKFPDFRFLKNNLIIEADGFFTHFTKDGRLKDRRRTKELEHVGFKVLSFNSRQIIKNQDEVRSCILNQLSALKR